jgi:hypothetical protein
MKSNIAKVLSTSLIAIALLSFAGVFHAHAAPIATLSVTPHDNIYYTNTTHVNDNITINIYISVNDTVLIGTQFKMYWDPTLLQGLKMVENLYTSKTPAGEEDNIWKIRHVVAADRIDYAYSYLDVNRAVTGGYAPFNVTDPYLVCSVILKVLKVPTMAEGFLDCVLDIKDIVLGDQPGNPITCTAEDGYYKIIWSAPTVNPYFSVEPSNYEATALYEAFNISVKINNLDVGWEAVGFEFKLQFNTTLLDVEQIYEGPWLPPFGNAPNGGTLPMQHEGPNYIQFGDVVMPDENGTWHTPFPSGSGVLAIITFNATYQGLFPEVASCPLGLYGMLVANWVPEELELDPAVNGSYSMRPKVLGRNIDIFTQYPDPYGGQGRDKPSDMFWPQKEVVLYGYVTYNEWPEQNKDVAFQVIDPHDNTYTVIYARTNNTGYAMTSFRLPWTCEEPEYYFGEWTVIGTVDVACTVVNDTLTFKYDYLVRIVKVTTDKDTYAHCEFMNITVEFKSYAMQTYDVILTVTTLDETGVPFGFTYVETTIGGAVYCHYKNYEETVNIHVIKWARAGTAHIVPGVLDGWPAEGGTVASGPFEPVPIIILAEWA